MTMKLIISLLAVSMLFAGCASGTEKQTTTTTTVSSDSDPATLGDVAQLRQELNMLQSQFNCSMGLGFNPETGLSCAPPECQMAPIGSYYTSSSFSHPQESLSSEWSGAYETPVAPNEGQQMLNEVLVNSCGASYLLCYMDSPSASLWEYRNCQTRPGTVRSDVGSEWDGTCSSYCGSYFRIYPLSPSTVQVAQVTAPEYHG